jgi:hypothetical protein
MAWTEITRRHFRRVGLRYESDTTDAEWFVMEPFCHLLQRSGVHVQQTSAKLPAKGLDRDWLGKLTRSTSFLVGPFFWLRFPN